MKKSNFRLRHHRRKVVRYMYAEDFVIENGLSIKKLNKLNDRKVIKLAKKMGWNDNVVSVVN